MPRVLNQLREVGDVTISEVKVSGDGGEHQHLNHQPTHRQGQADSVRSIQNFQYGLSFSSPSFTFLGQTECSNIGCGPSSSLLSLPSTGPPFITGMWQPGQLSLSCQAKEELVWWQEHLCKWNGKPLRQKPDQMVIQSDASLSGWGAVCK